ncbi:hypothetical protein [Lacinutrix sp. Hel_I_90]|uniref:hypothetical protein n=1 Tax=Lacinutrix sp. Hel_I_90 TaxID=1249999 RepID=UPI0005C98FF2|nr:hypothetical protein [Lacinutrix sp. Hel_I_90]
MKSPLILVTLLCVINLTHAQVGIGTTTPDDGSILEIQSTTGALVPPRMNDIQMNAIPTPLNGAIVYNTTNQALNIRTNAAWEPLSIGNNKTIVLNKEYSNGNNAIISNNNNYQDFPLNSTDIISTNPSVFEVVGNGKIKVKTNGIYLMSAEISVSNMPPGSTKYVLAAERNGVLIGYLSRGNNNGTAVDYWGTTGVLMYALQTDDIIAFRYVINDGTSSFDAKFLNIGMTKFN